MRLEEIARFLDTPYIELKEFIKKNMKNIIYIRQMNFDEKQTKEIASAYIKVKHPDLYDENINPLGIFLKKRLYTTCDIAHIWELNPAKVANTAKKLFPIKKDIVYNKRRPAEYYTYEEAIKIIKDIKYRAHSMKYDSIEKEIKLWW
jgi:hypothetical protein